MTFINIGIMQGRLLPKLGGRYQAFPLGHWEAEFHIAREFGISHIEFILDHSLANHNPLMSSSGIKQIQSVTQATGVEVRSVCADYFMEAPLHLLQNTESQNVLKVLLENAAMLGIRDMIIPCVDQSSLKSQDDQARLATVLKKYIPQAQKLGVVLNLETDLNPQQFSALLAHFEGNPWVRVNYDIGNSASLGFDVTDEFKEYGHLISELHIKDRVLSGGSVELGTGNAKFTQVFSLLKEKGFHGNIVLQASRAQDYRDEFPHVLKQLAFARDLVTRYLESA